ncbi:MAG TPA: ABC transporter substrate-binding protein [Anaerovoracaceae bacterium]|nr:ABC transporter substrate-binding protein [Anaerovoracaceae bacterium]
MLIRTLILTLILSLTLVGCSSEDGSKTENDGSSRELIIGISEEIEGTDTQTISKNNLVHILLYGLLLDVSLDGTSYLPDIAESYTISEDGLTWTFVLPEGAEFSNGDPFNAEAVKASFERNLEVGAYASDYVNIKEYRVIDDRTFALILSQPDPVLFTVLSSVQSGIVDVSAADEMGADSFKTQAVTYGPSYVEEWAQGSHITLKPNLTYKNFSPENKNVGPLNFDTITVRFIPDAFTLISELENGTIDIIDSVPLENVAALKENPDIKLYESMQPGASVIYMNTKDPILSDVNVRQAIALGIDRDEIAVALDNFVSPCYTFMSPSVTSYSQAKEDEMASKWSTDQEKAKALLESAGWIDTNNDGIREKDGKDMTIEFLVAMDISSIKSAAPVIQKQLKEIGVDLQLRELEHSYVKDTTKEGNFQMSTRSVQWADPMHVFSFTTDSQYYSNADLDALINDSMYIPDLDKRMQSFEQVTDMMYDQMPAVSLFYEKWYKASRVEIEGFYVDAQGNARFMDVTKKK